MRTASLGCTVTDSTKVVGSTPIVIAVSVVGFEAAAAGACLSFTPGTFTNMYDPFIVNFGCLIADRGSTPSPSAPYLDM